MRERDVQAARPKDDGSPSYLWDDKVRGLSLRTRQTTKTYGEPPDPGWGEVLSINICNWKNYLTIKDVNKVLGVPNAPPADEHLQTLVPALQKTPPDREVLR